MLRVLRGLLFVSPAPRKRIRRVPLKWSCPTPRRRHDNLMRMITGIIDENKWSPQPLNVVNRAGGSGAVGFNYLINKKGDAHTIAGATPMIVSGKIEGAAGQPSRRDDDLDDRGDRRAPALGAQRIAVQDDR